MTRLTPHVAGEPPRSTLWQYVLVASGEPFVSLRLDGGRYDHGGFPLETLQELTRYEDLITTVASALWRNRNQERQRLPRGFKDHFRLLLVGVESGSVIPVLERARPADALFHEDEALFVESRDLIQKVIAGVEDGQGIPADFPPNALRGFQSFGRSLASNEAIYIGRPGGMAVRFDQSVRSLILEASDLDTIERDTVVVGRVTMLDADPRKFTLTRPDGTKIPGRFQDPETLPDFRAVLDASDSAALMRLSARADVDRSGHVVMIQDVERIEYFISDEHPLKDRLIHLSSLRAGWFDGGGTAIDLTALEMSRDASDFLLAEHVTDLVFAYPMPHGGVQLEWNTGPVEWSMEFHPDLSIELHSLHTDSNMDELNTFTSLRDAIKAASGAADD